MCQKCVESGRKPTWNLRQEKKKSKSPGSANSKIGWLSFDSLWSVMRIECVVDFISTSDSSISVSVVLHRIHSIRVCALFPRSSDTSSGLHVNECAFVNVWVYCVAMHCLPASGYSPRRWEEQVEIIKKRENQPSVCPFFRCCFISFRFLCLLYAMLHRNIFAPFFRSRFTLSISICFCPFLSLVSLWPSLVCVCTVFL